MLKVIWYYIKNDKFIQNGSIFYNYHDMKEYIDSYLNEDWDGRSCQFICFNELIFIMQNEM